MPTFAGANIRVGDGATQLPPLLKISSVYLTGTDCLLHRKFTCSPPRFRWSLAV